MEEVGGGEGTIAMPALEVIDRDETLVVVVEGWGGKKRENG